MRTLARAASALLLTVVTLSCVAQQTATAAAPPEDPLLAVATTQLGRALILRCLCTGETLQFDAHGHLENKSHPEDWTLAAVDLQKVERKGPEALQYEGFRVAIKWADDTKEFQRRQLKTEPIRIIINGAATPAALHQALQAVFSLGIDRPLQLSLPAYWQHYFDPKTPWADETLKGVELYIPGGTVAGVPVPNPAIQNKPNAGFTEEASRDKITGPVVLRVIVDATGAQHHISIVQPIGYGLDVKAIEALQKAKFVPISVGGKPVAASVLVREEFTIAPPI